MQKNSGKFHITSIEVDTVTGEYRAIIPEWIINEMGWYEDTNLNWKIDDDDVIVLKVMNEIEFVKHQVFRETTDVIFYDISVKNNNATDLVEHAMFRVVSPPDEYDGIKQFYIHYHQVDHNRVLSGDRTFELVNPKWSDPYHISCT